MPTPKVLFFAGAPTPTSLHASAGSLTDFTEPFARFLGLAAPSPRDPPVPSATPAAVAAWRSLSLVPRPLRTDLPFSQTHGFHDQSLWKPEHFVTTVDVSVSFSAEDDADDALAEFCEQSLAAHRASQGDTEALDESSFNGTSFLTVSSTGEPSIAPPPPPGMPSHLSDLEDIPSAAQVLSYAPLTIALNLIVGVISIAQPRSITTRWGNAMSLVEVLVGDDTSSGFGVTFWLSSDKVMASDISKLRRQDVVLMQNISLRVFRGRVYGQSLRKGLTKVSLLWRRDGTGHYSTKDLSPKRSLGHPQQQKAKSVKEWVLKFVGAAPVDRSRRASKRSWDTPPDDTQ
ncbi:hypothetical protein S7711_05198 [Stachybotrys chartarum IBT 7711]|uniref:Uncharacterized protein n=1 Tax=Stachybotrys chartarum (strain CBS 109288 / IBT 7711) TaxID=1280523 RepID=A0A084ANG5_STACB|nr:hypothetical protein S7711_05198 [Stachybotrys chartarum IBT 7711]